MYGTTLWHKRIHLTLLHGILLAAVISLIPSLRAQSSYGSIVGVVTDNSGAVLPGASVTITNLGTNEKRSMQTGATGEFRFVNLLPADYQVEVQAKSFKRFVRRAITVQTDQTVRVDSTLQVGAAEDTVVVTAQAPLVETDSGTVGYQVEGKTVEEMPLNGRNSMNLVALVPGVVPEHSSIGSAAANAGNHTAMTGWNDYAISGAFSSESAMYIDAAPLNVYGQSNNAFIPSQDAVQEFKVATNSVSPEFGRFGGGIVEMTSKSGTNAFHGSLYEYFRNKVLNANDFFTKQAGQPREKWNQNQYGASLGGPIKKDKAFFFGSWEGFNQRWGLPTGDDVPSVNMQNGIFRDTAKDPATQQMVPRVIQDLTGACPSYDGTVTQHDNLIGIYHDATAGTYTIGKGCWDTTAAVMKNYFPAPQKDGEPDEVVNYYVTPTNGADSTQYNARLDYALSDKQRMFARYTFQKMQDVPASVFSNANGYKTGTGYSAPRAQQGVLGDTYTLNPSTILDVRVSYLRAVYNNVAQSTGADLTPFGENFANLKPQETISTLPKPNILGPDNLEAFMAMTVTSYDWYDDYTLAASISKMLRSHSLKYGMEARLMDSPSTGFLFSPGGDFMFFPGGAGDEFAAFLLGQYTDANIITGNKTTTFNYSQGYFISDTWQANRNLTINLGMRWEMPGSVRVKKDAGTVALPDTVDQNTGYYGTLALLNSGQYPSRDLEPPRYTLVGPRAGFALRLSHDFVVKGGYGLNYLPPDLTTGSRAFNSSVNNATSDIPQTPVPSYYLSQAFTPKYPNGILQPSGHANSRFMEGLIGQTITSPVPTTKYPYMQQWNLSLARQFKDRLMVQAGYVGSKGTRLPYAGSGQGGNATNIGMDELSSEYWSLGGTLLEPDPNGTYSSLGQSLRPYPQYQNFLNSAVYGGSSSYHSLQSQVQLRMKSGGSVQASYTWSKMISDTDSILGGGNVQDYDDLKAERSLSLQDVPHRLVVSYVLDVPFGKGGKYLTNVSGIADKLVSGWSLNGITSLQSGSTLSFSDQSGNALSRLFGLGMLRPKWNLNAAGCNGHKDGKGSAYDRVINKEWFNTACFAPPDDFEKGDVERVDSHLRSQGLDSWDFSLLKSTKVGEHVNAQFRVETFNIFNTPQFGPPGTDYQGRNWGYTNQQYNNPRQIQLSARIKF